VEMGEWVNRILCHQMRSYDWVGLNAFMAGLVPAFQGINSFPTFRQPQLQLPVPLPLKWSRSTAINSLHHQFLRHLLSLSPLDAQVNVNRLQPPQVVHFLFLFLFLGSW
jgi:hypothetical protein